MSPIYTRTGDSGETGLFGGGRVGKDDPRVDAYGEVDELNAALGVARSLTLEPDLEALARTLQEQLFTLGSVLATPHGSKAEAHIPRIRPEWIATMEQAIDRFDAELPAMNAFILPGGSPQSAALHLARTICRRAERRAVPLFRSGKVDLHVIIFLNRLSDLLFTMARISNHRAKVEDVKWVPPRD